MHQYIYSQGNEQLRQSAQAKIMHQQSLNLLREAGLDANRSVVDFGCGTADLAFDLVKEVGPVGKVLGVDYNAALISKNKEKKSSLALDNLNFRIGLAEEYSDIFLYDIAFARFLMAHAQNPKGLIKNMIALTKNYGVIAIEDVDISTMDASPFCPELEVLKTLMLSLVRYAGGDATIGPQLGTLMKGAGLSRIRVFEHQPAGSTGAIKQVPLKSLESMKPFLLKVGLATPDQLRRLTDGLRQMAEDNAVTFYFPKIYQAIGRNSQHLKFGSARYVL